ncbi:MAG: glycerol-3-phosphate dehydrogenase subunit GlpB [Halobacteriales archaeon]
MAIESDVLVIGGGLAGIISALTAIQEVETDRVRLISHTESTLRNASGLIDVLGAVPGRETPVSHPFEMIDRLPEIHPYRIVGAETVRDGLEMFETAVAELYCGGHTDRNALVPTAGGTIKPTARYPTSTMAGLASDDREMLLVGIETVPDFDAPLAAAHLRRLGVPFDVRGVTIDFPSEPRADAKSTRYAELLDSDDADVRQRLADRVRPHLNGADRVGFPALLGLQKADRVRSTLRADLDTAVFEVPMPPPSILGMRLENALFDALDTAGVAITTGNPIVDYQATDGRVDSVLLDRNGTTVPHCAEQYILATGGLVGSGIESDREVVSEPLFGCHVPHSGDRYDWFDDATFGEHAFARFGVSFDDQLRPLAADGEPEFRNLRAAGSVIGGYDFAAEKSGSGVSLATGFAAGTMAGTHT